ncbi:DUF2637 domain-containing protein [Nocardia sp. NPDC051750]|uniref:DUF2637 domain-containing protein n=1 Tax=Nocardia sp. NPDC051750 TaxID=3364325 RepID=UPI00378F3464
MSDTAIQLPSGHHHEPQSRTLHHTDSAHTMHSRDAVHHGAHDYAQSAPAGAQPHGRTKEETSAVRFFWAELLLVAAMSIAGNIIHAWINAPEGKQEIAAFFASFPPIALLAATHGVGLLVKAKNGAKFAYWCVVALTAGIAVVAFRLSFDALKELGVQVGMSEHLAVLMPIIIDGAIGQATIALLVLARSDDKPAVRTDTEPMHHSAPVRTVAVREQWTETRTTDTQLAAGADRPQLDAGPRTDAAEATHSSAPGPDTDSNLPAPVRAERNDRWESVAEALCEADPAGRRDPDTVAKILRLRHEQGLPHARIAEQVAVSSSTVTRTLTAARTYIEE